MGQFFPGEKHVTVAPTHSQSDVIGRPMKLDVHRVFVVVRSGRATATSMY